MTPDSLQEELRTFFDDFASAFSYFNGPLIAQRYQAPYLALQADGSSTVLTSDADIGAYFQRVVDGYRQQGCASCRPLDLVGRALGGRSALASLSWDLLREDGSVLSHWSESYTLVRRAEGWRIFASVDHSD